MDVLIFGIIALILGWFSYILYLLVLIKQKDEQIDFLEKNLSAIAETLQNHGVAAYSKISKEIEEEK